MYLNTNKKQYNIVIAKSFFKRFIGLMNKKNINYGLLIPKCNAIHTFFMKENIDVLGLDENNEVIYKYENLKPNKIVKITNPKKKTSILELPSNTSQKIKVGTIILFLES